MKLNYGCTTGTTARKPFKFEWAELDRCPLAILRDVEPSEQAVIHWAIEMAVSKRQGSLAAYIAPGSLSARGEALIATAEDVICAREQEALQRIREGGK